MSFSALSLVPLLEVFDMLESVAFYHGIVGFEVVSKSPEVTTAEGKFSHWMWLKLGAAELMLNTQYDSDERPATIDGTRCKIHGDTSLYIGCADIELAYEELTARGLKSDPPRMMPYGLKAFAACDPDGYRIIFQQQRV